MNIPLLLEKLEKSEEFKKFKESEEGKSSFPCAGFFILNFKSNIYEYSLDFGNNENIFTFKIPEEGNIIFTKEEVYDKNKVLEEVSFDVQLDIEDLRGIVEKALIENKIQNKLDEIIAVLQTVSGRKIWNLTCMLDGFTILLIHLDTEDGRVIKFEKKSLFDIVKKKE